MAETIWVSSSPRGLANGTTYPNAFGTLLEGINTLDDQTGKGHILNIVNDGVHTWTQSGSAADVTLTAGTSYSDPSCTIRGCDENGIAAKTTISPATTGLHSFARFRSPCAYVIIENLIFDASANYADVSEYTAIEMRDNATGPYKMRYCEMIGGASGSMAVGDRHLIVAQDIPSTVDQGIVEYCYWQNVDDFNTGLAGLKQLWNNCVFINDATAVRISPYVSFGTLGGGGSPTHVVGITNCHFYENAGATDIFQMIVFNPIADIDIGSVNCHSNVLWIESSGTVNPFFKGGTAANTGTRTGTIGSNVLIGGPSVAASDLTSDGWYQIPWDANDDDTTDPDVWPTDTVVYGEADSDMFNDVTSTYEWELPNGLTTTILKDLRLKKYTSAGLLGTTPGALPPVSSDGSGGIDPEDDENEGNNPYLDVRPLIAPEMKLSVNMGLRLSRNDVREAMVTRSDMENRRFREFKHERVQLAANTTTTFRSGIENADFLMVESTTAVQVSVGPAADNFWPAATKLVLSDGDFKTLQFKSGADSATILILEVD